MNSTSAAASALLSVTFSCGLLIAVSHVVNRSFIPPLYDWLANLAAFGCAVGASLLLGRLVPAVLSSLAVCCWIALARRALLSRRR